MNVSLKKVFVLFTLTLMVEHFVARVAVADVVAVRAKSLNQDNTDAAIEATSATFGFAVDDVGFNLGDVGIRTSLTDDVAGDPLVPTAAIAIASVSEFSRSDFTENTTFSLPAGRTALGTAGVNRISRNRFAITIAEVVPGLAPGDFVEANFDTAVGIFPDADGFQSGFIREPGSASNDFNGGVVEGTHAIDGTASDGIWTIDLTGLVTDATDNGILLASGAENRNNFVNTRANVDGTFTLTTHDNAQDGPVHAVPAGDEEFQFVYVPLTTPDLAAVGRVIEDTVGSSYIDIGTGNFSVDRIGAGEWFLSVTGADDSNSTLIITGGAEGASEDNFVAYEAGNFLGTDGWFVNSYDVNAGAPALEALATGSEVFSFVVIPQGIPEPATALLFVPGLAFIVCGRRVRK